MKRARIPALLFLTALMLGGCVSFGGKPPKQLLTLSPTVAAPADQARTANSNNSLMVSPPTTPQMLATNGLAVRTGGNAISYLKGAQWADTPARLFADLLGETIAARTDRVVVDRRQYAFAPGARLTGRLDDFQLDTVEGKVVVTFDAGFASGDGKPLLTRRFTASVATSSEQPVAVARALNEAANQVAVAIADWVK
jgi:cholesterol transport system auxiliary component